MRPSVRLSGYFMPTLKETPVEAEIASHRLMLRAGMVRQASSGIYSWLPLGLRVLKRIEQIVREEQDRAGAQELLMPTIQPVELWKKSGRHDAYGKEMLRITDRKDRQMMYGPTNEDLITAIFAGTVGSYKELPKLLYHIQWKFRDELRPRFGVMRGREFLMKDAYSFDLDYAGAKRSYNRMFVAYLRTFARMGLKAIPMDAETGAIGGNLSHEFIILTETGESVVYCHSDYMDFELPPPDIDYEGDLEPIVRHWTSLYAATEDKHDQARFAAIPEAKRIATRGIEVGQIFYFGTRYSRPLGATVSAPNGEQVPVHGGCYGVGVSRLVGAIIEASHDDAGIIWPEPVAPFKVGLINLKTGDSACDRVCADLYAKLKNARIDALYDDRDERPGAKFADMDLIGLPWQVIVGPRGIATSKVDLKRRATGERLELSIDSALARIIA
ncbi:MAG TPA: proline--tRNA ligase [Candidatus Acidoferrum sp.]|nr:proline--tRNA ligase [Candidatus Acidoferrum sp.]